MTPSPGSGKRLEHEPWERRDLSDLCRKLRLPSDFDVFQLCWQPDYDRFFFEQLKKRSINIFLFRGEFIFELARTAVAEVPQLGNATYVFTRPSEIREFVRRYATTTRDEIRRNRGNTATDGNVPQDAIRAGTDADGSPLYLCSANYMRTSESRHR